MTAVAARAPRAVESDPTLPVPLARGLAFLALAGFGGLHWMVLLDPPAPERALYALGAASLAIIGLLYAGRLDDRARPAAAIATSVVALALALLGGGIADELLRPDRWGSLASGISRGVESLPGVRVPYRGVDEWTRTVIPLGGTVLVTAAAIAAFWPRRGRIGFPGLALTLLVALYAVPAVSLDFENEFLRGAALALLVLAFLRLEKLRVGDASNAGLVAAGIAVLALMVAPALDRDTPWWDYESWALGAASARSTAFSWDHTYGPLDWPRDGRELLRVRAERRPAYWKAANLDGFDSLHWAQEASRDDDPGLPQDDEAIDEGMQEIRVTIRNLASREYITAGYADSVDAPTIRETPRGDGTWVAGRTLRRGDAYSASVYTPSTNESERREAPNDAARVDLSPFRRLVLPAGDAIQTGAPRYEFYFPAFEDELTTVEARTAGNTQPVLPAVANRVLAEGPYRRTWDLAQQLRRQAETQEDLVQAVLRYLRRGFAYTETPPRVGVQPGGLPVRRQARLLPAVLGRDGAAAADGRCAGAGGDRLHLGLARQQDARVRGARPGRPLVGRGLVRRHRLGHVRPDAGRRAAALAARRSRRRRWRERGNRPAEPRRRRAVRSRPAGARRRRGPVVGPDRARRAGRARARGGRRAAVAAAPAPRGDPAGGGRGRRAGAGAAAHEPLFGSGHHPALARGALRPQPRRGRLRARRARPALRRPAGLPDLGAAPRPAGRAGARHGARRPAARMVGAPAAGALTYTRFSMDDVYDLFKRGTALLEAGDFNSATVPLSKAAELEPEKTSIREALGRAYFRSRQFEEARVEFEAVVERAPTNDYALFCLGRALMELGRLAEARKPLTLASHLRPERRDYRIYREPCSARLRRPLRCYKYPTAFCRPTGHGKAGAGPLFS